MAMDASTKMQIEQLKESAAKLLKTAEELERKASFPQVPTGNFWRVDVQFTNWGATYTFLMVRHGSVWFTTGQDERTQKFRSWEKLWEWLEGPDVYAHSALQRLVHTSVDQEVEWGSKPKLGIKRAML